MKRWMKIFLAVFCLLFVQTPFFQHVFQTTVTVQAAEKKGLVKENGKYYYYKNGTRLKNAWKTVKVEEEGKTVSYRYYFGKDGAAYAGKKGEETGGVLVIAYKKIDGKYYGFDNKGRMVKGIYVRSDKFYVFNSKTGVYNASKTKKLRAASKYESDAKKLRKLLGAPNKTKSHASCGGTGEDLLLYYDHFLVQLFRDKNGNEMVLGVTSR